MKYVVTILILSLVGCARPAKSTAHKADVGQAIMDAQNWHVKQHRKATQ